jgi:hypothetical protein
MSIYMDCWIRADSLVPPNPAFADLVAMFYADQRMVAAEVDAGRLTLEEAAAKFDQEKALLVSTMQQRINANAAATAAWVYATSPHTCNYYSYSVTCY